ncbi:MAG TPA: aldo/keto reductase [Bryobacteraceae bacterium]|jgi:aryl-alcohol dehydrogenase-like predicted oxidoreductase|nr:aldo/keto reductase [Bryobacteraceae bacterium]
MNYRKLGKTNLEVSEIGYGAWGIGGKQWLGSTDDESIRALRLAIDRGLNFIDTALAYGDGHSEQLTGRVVKQSGEKVYIATKVPPKNQLWPARPGIGIDQVFPYDYILSCTEQSLRNLGIETIDVQQLHVWNPEWIDRDEWRRALEDLKKSGKVRYVGISINDHQPDSALEIIRTGLIDTVQVIYNVFDQTPEKNLFPLCQERNIGVLARVPLDEGSLAGTITADSRFDKDEFRAFYFRGDRKQQVVEHVDALRKDLAAGGVSGPLPEIALRFCISHPAVSTVIPGMRRVTSVESNMRVSELGALEDAALTILRRHAWDRNFYS